MDGDYSYRGRCVSKYMQLGKLGGFSQEKMFNLYRMYIICDYTVEDKSRKYILPIL